MRIPFVDPNEVHSGERLAVESPRALWRARAVDKVPVLASTWVGREWLCPHLALLWEPGTVVDLDPQAGGICYLITAAEYRRFIGGRRTPS